MLRTTIGIFTAIAALHLTPCASVAGELQPAHIPQQADWFAHFDFEAGADSKIFEKLTYEQQSGAPSRLGEWLSLIHI